MFQNVVLAVCLLMFLLLLYFGFRAFAKQWIRSHNEELVSKHRRIYDICLSSKNSLEEKEQKFVFAVNSLGLGNFEKVSSNVLANAENSPFDYLFKYSDLDMSEDALQKVDFCIGFLGELEEFKLSLSNLALELRGEVPFWVKVFLKTKNMPCYILDLNIRKGIHKISCPVFIFEYTSPAGRSCRRLEIVVNREMLIRIHKRIAYNLKKTVFTKKQRNLMSSELRETIKKRDNYTCCKCGNSIYNEPNLLLEVDHIIPVSKGGVTEPDNLQTLCWKCNREKSDKV